MNPVEQIATLQQMVKEAQDHNLKLIEENALLRAKAEIPRDMQQEANLLALDNADAALKGRVTYLEGEVLRLQSVLVEVDGELEDVKGQLADVREELEQVKAADQAQQELRKEAVQ